MNNVHLALRVNGEEREVSFAPQATLLEVLREQLDLTGTKHGCELGECGACAVLVDGKAILSCLALAIECEGRAITTIEGVAGASPGQPIYLDNVGHPAATRLALAKASRSHMHAFGIDWDETSGRNNGHFAPFDWSSG